MVDYTEDFSNGIPAGWGFSLNAQDAVIATVVTDDLPPGGVATHALKLFQTAAAPNYGVALFDMFSNLVVPEGTRIEYWVKIVQPRSVEVQLIDGDGYGDQGTRWYGQGVDSGIFAAGTEWRKWHTGQPPYPGMPSYGDNPDYYWPAQTYSMRLAVDTVPAALWTGTVEFLITNIHVYSDVTTPPPATDPGLPEGSYGDDPYGDGPYGLAVVDTTVYLPGTYGHGAYGAGPYGGYVGQITWHQPELRVIETGLDRGVLYPKKGPAVAWNGLTGVDEDGSDSAAEFVMDGRPFLYLPRPKEFKATLTAYTYPDELNQIMGMDEVESGLYLGSQTGDSCGLSYRTLIASEAAGMEAGYKIHLIYNVTMADQGAGYESLSDSVNPTEFSWQISAVPVPVPGARATAHIVIDTRGVDAAKLAQIEAILYGNYGTDASLPTPQALLDILGPGDTIIITDNGDGTWTALGSYSNVHLTDYKTYVINNVDAIDNGDGTFLISSTT